MGYTLACLLVGYWCCSVVYTVNLLCLIDFCLFRGSLVWILVMLLLLIIMLFSLWLVVFCGVVGIFELWLGVDFQWFVM